jgi:hypothetical protein
MVLRTTDCGAYRASLDLASNEYTIATAEGAPLDVGLSPSRTSIGGVLDVVALGAAAGMGELSIDNEAIGFEVGDCWPRGGALRGVRTGASGTAVTINFDPTTVEMGRARVSPAIGGRSDYELPLYGPCPDTRP